MPYDVNHGPPEDLHSQCCSYQLTKIGDYILMIIGYANHGPMTAYCISEHHM